MSIATNVRESQKVTEEYVSSSNGLQVIDVIIIGVVILVIMYIKKKFGK